MSEIQTLKVSFDSKDALASAFMPFVNDGGLFIATEKVLSMSERINLHVSLPEHEEAIELEAKVIWITPKGAQGNRAPGLGVQFLGLPAQSLKTTIETLIEGISGKQPHTL